MGKAYLDELDWYYIKSMLIKMPILWSITVLSPTIHLLTTIHYTFLLYNSKQFFWKIRSHWQLSSYHHESQSKHNFAFKLKSQAFGTGSNYTMHRRMAIIFLKDRVLILDSCKLTLHFNISSLSELIDDYLLWTRLWGKYMYNVWVTCTW